MHETGFDCNSVISSTADDNDDQSPSTSGSSSNGDDPTYRRLYTRTTGR